MAALFLFESPILLAFWILWPAVLGSVINHKPPAKPREMVIMDVDVGSDDALAIMMLASHKAKRETGLDVIAITCVNGNTGIDNVVLNVLKTLKTIERLDIPVYRGASQSIMKTPPSDGYFGKDGFGDFLYEGTPNPEKYLQAEHAVSALVRIVSQHPGEVTLVAIGPLTNIALAVRLAPNFLKNLKRLMVLGGSVNGVGNVKPATEFNFYMDPEAVDIVFTMTDKPICLVPWETIKIRSPISMAWRKKVLGQMNTPQVNLLNRAEKIDRSTATEWISADSFVALLVLQRNSSSLGHTPTFCGGMPVYGKIVIDCKDAGGVLLIDYANNLHKEANIEIIEKFDTLVYKDTVQRYLCP